MFKPAEVMLSSVLSPFISSSKLLINTYFSIDKNVANFAPIISGVMALIIFYILDAFVKLVDYTDKKAVAIADKTKQIFDDKLAESCRLEYVQDLANHKIIYLACKIRQKQMQDTSLYLEEEDLMKVKTRIKELTSEIITYSEKYRPKKYPQSKNEPDTYRFVFYNVNNAIDYAFYIYNFLNKVNPELISSNHKLSFSLACHCSCGEDTSGLDFAVTDKMINLANENEILVSEIFKDKYEIMKKESNLKFITRGVYMVLNNEMG
jgi:hypothetical protein